ncbi:hypothetical protein [Pelomicrobium sp. G1]|uniref:hypothetical protein n=1 Tax=unclassified Pelomicrobium TaxID=2815318 RepID=UPI003F775A41
MPVMLIVCDPAANAGSALEAAVADHDGVQIIEGCFLIKTREHPRVLAGMVEQHLPGDTTFYVFELDGRYDGFGPVDVNKWLRKNLKK